ncbi:MAG: peptidase MA family metallohydrolase, partial [Desulfobacterales bacterium]
EYLKKMGKCTFIFILFFWILTPAVLMAVGPSTLNAPELEIVYDEGLDQTAHQVLSAYPSIKRALESMFQWPVNFRSTLVLINNHKKFQQLAGHELVVAYALPEKNVVVIDYSKMNMSPFTLQTIVKHELCHLLLHQHITKDNLPRWLDEGVCQWASDGLADILMDSKRTRLPAAILSGSEYDLVNLAQRFPRDKNGLILAYEQSKSVVEYMSRQYGPQSVHDLLSLLQQGADIESAVETRFAISLETFQEQWRNHLKASISWFTYLSIHLYEIVFVSAALLTVLGFIRSLLRKKAYEKDNEEMEDF